jgi:metallo-beta-lactamase class B
MKKKALFLFCFIAIADACWASDTLKISMSEITPDIYVHTSYKLYDNIPVPSNGMIINTSAGIVLIDTGWDEAQTEQLLVWIKKRFKKKITFAIVTHAHEDRIAGLRILEKNNIKVLSTRKTADKIELLKYPKPKFYLPSDTTIKAGSTFIRTFFPGEGHTEDNIVVYLQNEKLLFGGCLIKSCEAQSLGYIKDANLDQWGETLIKVKEIFTDVKIIIPGIRIGIATIQLNIQ